MSNGIPDHTNDGPGLSGEHWAQILREEISEDGQHDSWEDTQGAKMRKGGTGGT